MVHRIIRTLSEKVLGNEWDRLLDAADRRRARRFLLFWNRGLGDIALGLYQVIAGIRARIPDVGITVVTRSELAEAFQLLAVNNVVVDDKLVRGEKEAPRMAFRRLKINPAEYDVVLDRIDPTRWFAAAADRLQPKLAWRQKFDLLTKSFDSRFDAPFESRFDGGARATGASCLVVGAHVDSETGAFYGYRKDWPAESWQALFAGVEALRPVRFVLFGSRANATFDGKHCVDLRGKTSFLEMMALIKNRCSILIAPDSGILTMTYYLDAQFPIDIVSLWADPHQGILKHDIPSPNRLLRHVPLTGDDDRVENIGVEHVVKAVALLAAKPLKVKTP